jgi:hypothetical protein
MDYIELLAFLLAASIALSLCITSRAFKLPILKPPA